MGKVLIIKGADFSQNAVENIDPPTPGTVEITVVASPAGGGTVTGGGSYAEGAEVVITATANTGYTFVKWSDENTSASRTITVGSTAQTYTAIFQLEVPAGYGAITLDGSEDWLIGNNGNPNSNGYYNCYFYNPNVVNPAVQSLYNRSYFQEATCNNQYFNRNIVNEAFADTNQPGFMYIQEDPALALRFNDIIATSVETLKQWLTNNPITITYKQNT